MPETDNMIIPMKSHRRMPRWVRSLTATAAVIAILLTGSITAKAFGFNVWKAVIQWTQETFHFGSWGDSKNDNNLPYASLQDALEQGEVFVSLAPNWIPDGFELADITVDRSPLKKTYTAIYTEREKDLIITVRDYLDEEPVYVEQGEGLTEEYEVSGILYYIFTDIDLLKAKWINSSYECSISGNVTIEELKMMIDSIGKG